MAKEETPRNGTGGRSWIGTLFGYARRCRGKMALSFIASVASVGVGFVPFYCVYRLMAMAIDGTLSWEGSTFWLVLAAAAYVASKLLFGASPTSPRTRSWHLCARTSCASS